MEDPDAATDAPSTGGGEGQVGYGYESEEFHAAALRPESASRIT